MNVCLVLLLLQLYVVLGHSPNSKRCLILRNYPGTCLHFLTNQTYTYKEGKKACWNTYQAVPFVPMYDDDVADLLRRFYFHASNDSVYQHNLGLGICIRPTGKDWREYRRKNGIPVYYREHLANIISSENYATVDIKLWNDTVYQGKLSQVVGDGPVEMVLEHLGTPNGSVNRDKAIEYCKQNEANLASIHNQREYDIYYSLVKNQNLTETQKSAEYWFGLRHQNDVKAVHEGGLGTSASAGFDKRYMDVAYFVDGTNYTGFHRFHKDEPTHNSKQENFNGQTFTADGWYRNWDGASKVNGALCRSAIDTSAVQHSTINEKRPFC